MLSQKSALGDLLEDVFRQENVTELKEVVLVFLAVLDFVWEVRH
jgi:hypothetical protein